MNRLTVLLAPGGPLTAVLSVLQDWSGARLIDDFVWTPAETIRLHDADVLLVRGGVLHGGTLRNVIADLRPESVTLCVLVPRLDEAGVATPAQEQALAQLLDTTGGTPPVRVRCVITRTVLTSSPAEIARDGWHNIVLSPEDTARPTGPSVPLSEATDVRQLGAHSALGLAGILGMWSGSDSEPAVFGPSQAGRSARLARSYFRRLRVGAVEDSVRRAVLSNENGFPRPRRLGLSDVYAPEPARATMGMADMWWRAHRGAIVQPREAMPQEQPRTTGVFEALKEFFSFLWAAVRNAPGSWLDNKKRQLAAGIARRVTAAVYGAGSAYTVVVNGVTGDGMPVGWLALGHAVGDVEAALDAAHIGLAQESTGELGALWSDFVAGGLTLADGATRVDGLPPIQVDGGIGVVRDASQIAPTDQHAFVGLSGHLAAVVDIDRVEPADVMTRFDLERRLAAHAADPDLQLDINQAEENMRRWRAAMQSTYAVRVAEHIGKAQLDTRTEIAQLLASLDESTGRDGERDAARQQTLGRRIRLMLAATLVALGAVAAVVGIGLLAIGLGIGIGAVVLLGGLAGMARVFYVRQKHVFQMLYRREQFEHQGAIRVRNLRSAMCDLRRQIEAYGQLQVWAKVLATFLAAPFGHDTDGYIHELGLAGPFPRGMSIGDVAASNTSIDAVVADLRRDVFAVGWLSAPWDEVIAAAADLVGPGTPDTLEAPRALYNKPSGAWATDADSFLAIWGAQFVRHGAPIASGERIWSEIRDSFNGERARLAGLLTSQIQALDGPGPGVDAVEFLGGIEQSRTTSGFFDSSVLTDSGASRGLHEVVTEVPSGRPHGLARSVALTQFSADIPHYDFAPSSRSDRSSGDGVTPADVDGEENWAPPAMPGLSGWTQAGDHAGQQTASPKPDGGSTTWSFGRPS